MRSAASSAGSARSCTCGLRNTSCFRARFKNGGPGLQLHLPQIAAEALDARAGLFKRRGRGRVGNAERGTYAERRTLHHGHAFRLQKLVDEVLVRLEFLALL